MKKIRCFYNLFFLANPPTVVCRIIPIIWINNLKYVVRKKASTQNFTNLSSYSTSVSESSSLLIWRHVLNDSIGSLFMRRGSTAAKYVLIQL